MGDADWASLAPELLVAVLQRVQDGAGERGEGRRVVALAGVCRSWRSLVLHQDLNPQSSLLHFPASIRQPAPTDAHLQCLLKKKGSTFTMFQTVGDDDREYFLLAARRQFALSQSCFRISTDPRSFSANGRGLTATLKSNIWRSVFSLRDSCATEARKTSAPPTLSVQFHEMLVHGTCQRQICCSLQATPRSSPALEPWPQSEASKPAQIGLPSRSARKSLWKWSCLSNSNSQVSHDDSFISAKEDAESQIQAAEADVAKPIMRGDENGEAGSLHDRPPGCKSKSFSLTSKAPAWNEQHQCWSLDFKGRATVASIHNFQLVDSTTGASEARSDRVVLQLGKVGKGLFIVDFGAPLSPLGAFSICLSSFATGAGLEP